MLLLTEKYRPKCREELVGNRETIDKIFSMVNSGKLCHLCLEGPSGVGKTSIAIIIAKTLFGDFFKGNFLELNASDSRKIEDVRGTIKVFAKTSPFGASFKIILLDEGDEMTPEAQNALRRIMEKYSEICIFIFSVNNAHRLIDPIKSRCQIFHFGPLSVDEITNRLSYIYLMENLKIQTSEIGIYIPSLRKIAEFAQGDMRRALNHLQVLLASGEPLTSELVESIRTIDYGRMIFDSLQKGRFLEARKHLHDAKALGYPNREILRLIQNIYISEPLDISEMKTAIFEIAEADYRLTLGVDPILLFDKLLLVLLKT